ncbi:MAG: D-alanine--D-alanine ligase [Aestuariibacter sp.]
MAKTIVVLYGGDSAEREVSLRSGKAVLEALQNLGLNATGFDPAERSVTELASMNVAKVLIMLHGRGGEDGAIQGALQTMGLAYTGSDVLGSALAMDKIRSKQIFESLQLPTADYRVIHRDDFRDIDAAAVMTELGGTVMVKPSLEGSSIGMTKVLSASELGDALVNAFKYDDSILIERFVEGQEFTVSIVANKVLPSIRMQTPRTFYDYQAKYQSDTTEYFCPSGLSDTEEQELGKLSLSAFQAVGASGWGRVDLMRDEDGHFYLLEVNTVPGMTEKSLVPMAAKQAGMRFEDLVRAILETG